MIKFSIEKIADIWDELLVNYEAHWKETEEYRYGQELNMDKERYLQYEGMGLYFMFTARDNGKLVGNFGIYVMPSMHTGKLIATEDSLFVLPEYRKDGNAAKFCKFVEDDMRRKNVWEVVMTAKVTNKAWKFMERLGYNRVAYQYSKHLVQTAPTLESVETRN